MNTTDDDGDVLYDLACECEALFDTQSANLRAQTSSLSVADLVAEYQQRFAIWAAHLGVFARKSQSLDTRLRNHADIQDLVARLLGILRRSLHQLTRASEASGANGLSQAGDDVRRDEALSAIDAALTRLNRLGVTIRKSSHGGIDVKIQRFAASLDLGPFAAISQTVVQQLYPNGHQSLQQYLGKTMVDRYAALLFRKYRDDKLQSRRPGKPIGFMPTIDEERQGDPGRYSPGQLASGTSQEMLPKTSGYTNLARIPSAASQSDLSTINGQQLRLTLHRTNNFQVPTERRQGTSSVQVGHGNYPRPSQKDDNFFTCEWCGKIIEKQDMNDSDWRRHVDEDLKPYTCISDACSDGHPAFPSFALWLSHMKEHNRRWHQRAFPTSGWVCALCDDSPEIHTGPEALHGHLVQAHGDLFPESQLQAIARQSKVERPRPWDECLFCCFKVEETEPPPKRRKEQLVNKAGNKSSRTSFAIKHPKLERETDQGSDASGDSLDVPGLTLTDDNAKTMARHIATHLQALMLLTIRLAFLSDDHSQETQDHANSASVDAGDSDEVPFTKSARESAAETMSIEGAEIPDVDGEALEVVDMPQVDHIPDAVVDFDGVPRQYDELPVEEDEFLQELTKSGAYQAHLHRLEHEGWNVRPENEGVNKTTPKDPEVEGAAESAIAVIELAAKVDALCLRYLPNLRLEYSPTAENSKQNMRRLRQQTKALKTVAKDAQQLLQGPNGVQFETVQNLRKAFAGTHSLLDGIYTELEEKAYTGRGGQRRRRIDLVAPEWPLETKDFDTIITKLQRGQDTILAALQIDQTFATAPSHLTNGRTLATLYPVVGNHGTKLPDVDVVLVHGLDSVQDYRDKDRIKTWTAEDGTVWPRDLLPKYMPDVRVLCYEHNGSIRDTASPAGIEEHAQMLLRQLRQKRPSQFDYEKQTPIVFVGHSLGGAIIKQALILACFNPEYMYIARATYGIIFFATPHHLGSRDGGEKFAWSILRAFQQGKPDPGPLEILTAKLLPPSPMVIERIKSYSESLTYVTAEFQAVLKSLNVSVVNFCEADVTKGLREVVVSQADAFLEGADNQILAGDHIDICKFCNNEIGWERFEPVWRALKRLATMQG
ncbi:hypothetical protein RB594_002081 [Gaeumannomyces avenae]